MFISLGFVHLHFYKQYSTIKRSTYFQRDGRDIEIAVAGFVMLCSMLE